MANPFGRLDDLIFNGPVFAILTVPGEVSETVFPFIDGLGSDQVFPTTSAAVDDHRCRLAQDQRPPQNRHRRKYIPSMGNALDRSGHVKNRAGELVLVNNNQGSIRAMSQHGPDQQYWGAEVVPHRPSFVRRFMSSASPATRGWGRAGFIGVIGLAIMSVFALNFVSFGGGSGGEEAAGSTAQPGECRASSSTLGEAITAYGSTCELPRVDCDPMEGGWVCSSHQLGSGRPDGKPPTVVVTAPPTTTPPTEPPATTVPPPSPPTTATPAGPCTATGATLAEAIRAYNGSCTLPRVDCDPVDGQWICSSEKITGGGSPAPAPTNSPSTNPPTPNPGVDGPFDRSKDLLSLHYDHAADPDDGHATVSAKVVVDTLGLTPWVIGGACGDNCKFYVEASEPVMRAAWGNNWQNAIDDRDGVLTATADRWQRTLEAGGDVWVAEGGQSDLSADVVRELKRRMSGLDSRRVHIVQHSDWNERHTTDSDLSYVKQNTDYIRIEDGNHANKTADLNRKTSGWERRALNSRWGSAWKAAFDYLDPDERLDFSDTVELLHILGIGKDEIADPNDFADRFFRAAPTTVPAPPTTTRPTPTTTKPAPTTTKPAPTSPAGDCGSIGGPGWVLDESKVVSGYPMKEWAKAGVRGGIPCSSTVTETVSPGGDIQRAINSAAATGGGVVLLQSGTHRLSSPVSVKSNVVLRGENRADTRIEVTMRQEWNGYSSKKYAISLDGVKNAGVENLTMFFSVPGYEPYDTNDFGQPKIGSTSHWVNDKKVKRGDSSRSTVNDDRLYVGFIRLEDGTSDSWVQNTTLLESGTDPISTDSSTSHLTFRDNDVYRCYNKGGSGNCYIDIRGDHVLFTGNRVRQIRHVALQGGANHAVLFKNDFEVDVNFHSGDDGDNLVEQNRMKLPAGHQWSNIATGGARYGHDKPGNGNVIYRNDAAHEKSGKLNIPDGNAVYTVTGYGSVGKRGSAPQGGTFYAVKRA